jgi:hypothetical protein
VRGQRVAGQGRLTKYLHGAISQKRVFFIVIAVKTSKLT